MISNFAQHGWETKKIFHIISPKTTFSGTGLHLILADFYIKKNCIKELRKNHLKINYVEFRIHALKDHICFYKTSTNQTFIVISSKVVYFPLPFDVPYRSQKIKLAVGAMTEPLLT